MKTKLQERIEARIDLLTRALSVGAVLSQPNAWLDETESKDVSFPCPTLTLVDNAATTMVFAHKAKARGRLDGFQKLRAQAYRSFPSAERIEHALVLWNKALSRCRRQC